MVPYLVNHAVSDRARRENVTRHILFTEADAQYRENGTE